MSEQTTLATRQPPPPIAAGSSLGELLKKFALADRTARWASRVVLIGIWQLAGMSFERIPTPWAVLVFLKDEFGTPYAQGGGPWAWYRNELVSNTLVSLQRATVALLIVFLVGLTVGFALGRWWRIQALLTDMVTVAIALPAFIWSLLAVMWFGFSNRAPIFVCVVSATPMLVVNVFRGALAVPRELRDMSDAYGVPFRTQFRTLMLPAMAEYILAGFRIAILAGWGSVILVEWFGNNMGSGYRAHYWYDAYNFAGLLGWAIVILAFVITVDRAILERIIRKATRWRTTGTSFG